METILMRVQKALQKEFSHRGIHLEPVGVDSKMVAGWIISKSLNNGVMRREIMGKGRQTTAAK
jgi:hypothetical protein